MGKGLRIQTSDERAGAQEPARIFHEFPVRIGRDALNQLELQRSFVSKFHASLEILGDTVVLRDLGSRNGTFAGSSSQAIAAGEAVDLRPHGFAFRIGSLHFRTAIVDAPPTVDVRERGEGVLSERARLKTARMPSAEGAPKPASSDGDLALAALQHLARWYGLPALDGPASIVEFARRVQDVLDATFESYVRLRDGLKHFEAEFLVSRGRAPGVLEGARTTAEVGARMLDGREPAGAAASAIQRLTADVAIHEIGMLNGVMKGVAALLAQLSPDTVRASFEAARRSGRTGFALGPFEYRELWRHYETRHADYAGEEKHAFAALFGREFAAAYENMQASLPEEEERP